MRQQIDCAVLVLEAHATWMPQTLEVAQAGLARIRLHHLDWEAGQDLDTAEDQFIHLPVHAIAQASVSLRRFDVCLLPVSIDSLGWTRQALAAIPRGPFLPIVGIFRDLKSAAMQDLLELGLADFVRLPLCPDEFRARLLATVARVPRMGSLRESDHPGQAAWLQAVGILPAVNPSADLRPSTPEPPRSFRRRNLGGRPVRHVIQSRATQFGQNSNTPTLLTAKDSFRESKARLIERFEKEYIEHALERAQGNIAMAARASNKHRRAFWALMRKYEIDAEQYRVEDL
ncbi:MAG: helix-turn-helix domain-containing protein [Betaproteobacteria bacterium]